MESERTYKKIRIELYGVEKDIDLVRAGYKDGQIIEAERELYNGKETHKCHIKLKGGKKFTLYIGFTCRMILEAEKT